MLPQATGCSHIYCCMNNCYNTLFKHTKMNKPFYLFILLFFASQSVFTSCNEQTTDTEQKNFSSQKKQPEKYNEGTDYLLFERVRILDKAGFTEPQEAYSLLLPKGWTHESEVMWTAPGNACSGTFKKLRAKSADGKYSFEIFPDATYGWNTNAEANQFREDNSGSPSLCAQREPVNAEQYLRNVFVPDELGNPEIIKVESNQYVIEQMQQGNEKIKQELSQYGAVQMQFHQTAINANVEWSDGAEGLVTLGVSILENVVPNIYDGSSSTIYTTAVMNRVVFKFPKSESEQAKNLFSVVMGSIRTNPMWNEAVNKFWKDSRQQSNIAHLGRIKMIDEQTRKMGEQAISSGQERLNNMDMNLRSWEKRQNSQDQMHTSFIKTIREVENYQDETGKYELTSSYNQAWSRGDGSTFIMSNNPNFDPASVLQDQSWKEMKKVD